MRANLIYPAGTTQACMAACKILAAKGFSFTDHPTPEITHLLLDVPSFRFDGRLRDRKELPPLLAMLPQNIQVIGGNLQHPALEEYRTMDLLKDAGYLAQNAAITAECTIKVAAPLLKTTFSDTPTLILGWGRIGKCLGALLKGIGCPVTIAARKEADRAMLQALGYEAVSFDELPGLLPGFRMLINTVPDAVLDQNALALCRNCVKLELASRDGITGEDVVIARGLPGVYAPDSSGKCIAETLIRLWKENRI